MRNSFADFPQPTRGEDARRHALVMMHDDLFTISAHNTHVKPAEYFAMLARRAKKCVMRSWVSVSIPIFMVSLRGFEIWYSDLVPEARRALITSLYDVQVKWSCCVVGNHGVPDTTQMPEFITAAAMCFAVKVVW